MKRARRVVGSPLEVGPGEEIAVGCDFTVWMISGDVLTSPSTNLEDMASGATITLTDPPSITGNTVLQIVRGSELTPGHAYSLVWTATLSSTKTLQAEQVIVALPI